MTMCGIYIQNERSPRYRGFPRFLLYYNSSTPSLYTNAWCKCRSPISVYYIVYVVQMPQPLQRILYCICGANVTAPSAYTILYMWCKCRSPFSVYYIVYVVQMLQPLQCILYCICGANATAPSVYTILYLWCKSAYIILYITIFDANAAAPSAYTKMYMWCKCHSTISVYYIVYVV